MRSGTGARMNGQNEGANGAKPRHWGHPVAGVAMIVVGTVAWVYLLTQHYTAVESEGWPSAEGIVTHSEVVSDLRRSGSGSHSGTGSAGVGTSSTYYVPEITYLYKVGSRGYRGNQIEFGTDHSRQDKDEAKAFAATYPIGTKVAVHYDPDDPGRAVLRPGASFGTTIFPLFVVLILLPAGFAELLLVGKKSSERHVSRAVLIMAFSVLVPAAFTVFLVA